MRRMTVDDENSVYVGGLPYDSTEDSVRRAFEMYGTIVGVKIVNDREVGGKCYGFVTFTNPRSAVNAIDDMDGRSIGGRTVRVNEVRSKQSRATFGRDNSFRDREKIWDRERNRDKGRDDLREEQREHDRERTRDQDMNRDVKYKNKFSIGRHVSSPREQKHSSTALHSSFVHSHYERERSPRGRSYSGSSSGRKWDVSSSPSPKRTDWLQMNEKSKRHKSTSAFKDRDPEKIQDEIIEARHQSEKLRHTVSILEEQSKQQQIQLSEMKRKTEKLEESIHVAKNKTLQRHAQLKMLQNAYLQVREYSDKLKLCEQELQSMVDASVLELNGID